MPPRFDELSLSPVDSSREKPDHWETVYATKSDDDVSWTQAIPTVSLEFIRASTTRHDQPIIDVGAGNFRLVDAVLEEGFTDLTALDIAQNSLERSRQRLGERADRVRWLIVDVRRFDSERRYALRHDRAVFHFLTDPEDRERALGADFRLENSRHQVHVTPAGHEQPFTSTLFRRES